MSHPHISLRASGFCLDRRWRETGTGVRMLYLVSLGIKARIDHIRRDWTISTEMLTNIRRWEWVVVGRLLGHLSHHPGTKVTASSEEMMAA